MHEEEDQDDHDDQDAEDCEDGEEEDDGSSHATVVADPAETTKPQGEREVLEKDETRRPRRRRRRGRRRGPRREEEENEAECLPATCESEMNRRSL